MSTAKKKTVKRTGIQARGKVVPASKAPNDAVPVKDDKFFGSRDTRLQELTAPGVYHEAYGSHTTILLYVGRSKVQHVPMSIAGLRVVSTPLKQFRGDWVRASYSPAQAAAKYLAVTLFEVTQRARVALEAVRDGGDEKLVKAVLDQRLPGDEPDLPTAPGDSLGAALGAIARSAKKPTARGANLPKGRGIGAWVCEQLIMKVADVKILKEVQVKFPGAKTNAAHLAWYRGKLRREGVLT